MMRYRHVFYKIEQKCFQHSILIDNVNVRNYIMGIIF